MKKIFTLLFSMVAVISSYATSFSFSADGDVNQTKDGITVAIAKGDGNNAPAFYSNGLRLYASNTITITADELTEITLTFAKQGTKAYSTLTASAGSLVSAGESTAETDLKSDKWTGNAKTVTFTLGSTGQRLIKQITVNGGGSETDPSDPTDPTDPTEPDTPSTLDPNYKYDEPTKVGVPSQTVQGAEYTFIDNNILVSCTKGAVTESYFSAHAGFEMTFTATQNIKGLVINGFVKKDFEATVDHGKISYLTPAADTEADPVVVITDVDSKSVTISCVKQLRCYSVEVYFDANPSATVSGGTSGGGDLTGEDKELTFDSADAVYESEFSEWLEEDNYSIFLYNQKDPDYLYFALDIYPTNDDLTGTYSYNDYTLGDYTYYSYGTGEYDAVWIIAGEVTISKTNGEVYTISGKITCDNGATYTISYTGVLPFYLDSDYYAGEGDDAGASDIIRDENGIDAPSLDSNAPMYNLKGQRVNGGTKGIVIQNGRKFMLR